MGKQELAQRAKNASPSKLVDDAKLNLQIKKLEYDAKLRKEQFGRDVADIILSQPTSISEVIEDTQKEHQSPLETVTGVFEGLCCGVATSTVGKLSAYERSVQACVEKFKRDVRAMKHYKEQKLSTIEKTKV